MGVVTSKLSAHRQQRRRRVRRSTTTTTCCSVCGSSRTTSSRDKRTTAVSSTSHNSSTTDDNDTPKPSAKHHNHTSPPTPSSPSSITLAKPTTPPSQHGTTITTTITTRQQRQHSSSTASSTSTTTDAMASRLSEGLKALINAPHALPGYTKASPLVVPALIHLAQSARSNKVGIPAWITLSTAVSATLNCPEAMTSIFHLANEQQQQQQQPSQNGRTDVQNAELIREVGLKCISFNGIPRTINTLGAFHASLPSTIQSQLKTVPKRRYTPQNLEARQADGLALWDSVYRGFERKLIDKLATSHPDLPVHILASHYSNLLSDPSATSVLDGKEAVEAGVVEGAKVGRVLTSLVAIACLRAQTGVGPQVVSHVFGLRKAYADRENCGAESAGEDVVEGGEWLASEEGNVWLLESVDRLVEAITGGSGKGSTFAPGFSGKGSKL